MSEITIPGDGPFMEHIDLTHPASDNLASPAVVAEINADDAHDQQPIERLELTEEEQAAIDSIGDHSSAKDIASADATWKRDELNKHAENLGIEAAAELPNKDAVLAAIEEAEAK